MAVVLTRRPADDDVDLRDIQVAAKCLPSAFASKQSQHKNRSRRETEKNCHYVGVLVGEVQGKEAEGSTHRFLAENRTLEGQVERRSSTLSVPKRPGDGDNHRNLFKP